MAPGLDLVLSCVGKIDGKMGFPDDPKAVDCRQDRRAGAEHLEDRRSADCRANVEQVIGRNVYLKEVRVNTLTSGMSA